MGGYTFTQQTSRWKNSRIRPLLLCKQICWKSVCFSGLISGFFFYHFISSNLFFLTNPLKIPFGFSLTVTVTGSGGGILLVDLLLSWQLTASQFVCFGTVDSGSVLLFTRFKSLQSFLCQSYPELAHAMFAKCYINSSTKPLCVLESSKIFIFKVKFLLPGILEAFLHLPFIIIFVESCIL